ncbi:hypothetical protein GGP79_002778 [Salinibacter ruber]|uniref:DUF2914 domain-containing protein n=1 Tax=Salinibacter ruber TaxID=146919 RepID=UPI002167F552|nr:DUF2914 domain-containing protein [Salinibacter ruber]MCS3754803.1 hypothetical protein [Salinibacter ruber]
MSSNRTVDSASEASLGMGSLGRLVQGLVRRPHYRLVRRLYHRHETLAPLLLFFGGVTWDALTLQRIGALLDNVILGGYLLLLGGAIALTLLDRHGRPLPPSLRALSTWSVGAIQFLTGGLFSAYVIYYTRSASLTTASLFLLVLVGLLLTNEWIWSRHQGGHLLIGLYFLAVFCYLTFLLPVVLGTMGFWVFLTSGILSIGVTTGLLLVLRRQGVFVRLRSFLGALCVIALLFGGLTTFYVQHWIPPVPLALEHIGVYHDADRAGDAFVLRQERASRAWFWTGDGDDPFHYAPTDTVHCFTAIYAPTAFQADVTHRWQRYVPSRDAWVDTDRIAYQVVGGRRSGYRGVTYKQHVSPGRWRVTVETEAGRPIGRTHFTVVAEDPARTPAFTTHRYP